MTDPAPVCRTCAAPRDANSARCGQCGREYDTTVQPPVHRPLADESDMTERGRAFLASSLGPEWIIGEQVGRGGFASVYAAWDVRLKRHVAIKTLRADRFSTPEALERFRREAHIVARLQHPNIVPLYSFGEVDDLVFLVMPLIRGDDLALTLRREGRASVQETCRVVSAVAGALGAAHREGIVHRDIKPANIMLEGSERHVVVMDFGISKSLGSGEHTLTNVGMALGTPDYMSPEQASGDRDLDPRSDQYSLALVALEMLATNAAEGKAAAPVWTGMRGRPPALADLRPELPRGLSAVLQRALSSEPDARYATIAQFAAALLDASKDEPTPTGAARRSPVGHGTIRSRPTVRGTRAALYAIAGIVVFAVLGIATLRASRDPTPDPRLIAIVPLEPASELLRATARELTDALERNLDGAGPLRSLRTPQGGVTLTTARPDAIQLARANGAALALTGELLPNGPDSVRLRVVVTEVSSGQPLGEVEASASALRPGALSDHLTVDVLRLLASRFEIAALRDATIPRTSIGALKAYLRGEYFYRRADFDSAVVAYERAVTLDSTLALGWLRLGMIEIHTGQRRSDRRPANIASSLNRGLSPRDSLLIVIDSLYSAASDSAGNGILFCGPLQSIDCGSSEGKAEGVAVRLAAVFQTFPVDQQLHVLQVESNDRWQSVARHATGILDGGRTAVWVTDSGFMPLVRLAIRSELIGGQRAMARRLLIKVDSMNPPAEAYVRESHDLLLQMLDTSGSRALRTSDAIGRVSAGALGNALNWLLPVRDSTESTVLLARPLAARDSTERWPLVFRLAERGHLREALAHYRRGGHDNARVLPFLRLMATVGIVARDSLCRDETNDADGGGWFALAECRDSVRLQETLSAAIQRLQRSGSPAERRTAEYDVAVARGLLALARADTGAATRYLLASQDSVCESCRWVLLAKARLLSRAGRTHDALNVLLRAPWHGPLANDESVVPPVQVLLRLERAKLFEEQFKGERMKNPDVARNWGFFGITALDDYHFVAQIWQNADPELQPFVREAREGRQRLEALDPPEWAMPGRR